MITYIFDPIDRRWYAAVVVENGRPTHRIPKDVRDLLVCRDRNQPPVLQEGVRRFHPERGGWSDAAPRDPSLVEDVVSLESFIEEAVSADVEGDPEPEPDGDLDDTREENPEEETRDSLPLNPEDYTVDQLVDALTDIDSVETLQRIHKAERNGKNRTTALEEIDRRIVAVESEPEE